MEMPFEYTIFCNKTKQHEETNEPPLLHHLQTWEDTADPKVKELKQTKTAYIDTRYKAKLRLYNYIHKIKPYRPFEGTEIGKTIPILNF